MNNYKKIYDPKNSKFTKINSIKGKNILNKFILSLKQQKNINRNKILNNIKKNILNIQLNEKKKILLIYKLKTNIAMIEKLLNNFLI